MVHIEGVWILRDIWNDQHYYKIISLLMSFIKYGGSVQAHGEERHARAPLILLELTRREKF